MYLWQRGPRKAGLSRGVCPATAQNGRQDAREGTLPAGAPWKALPRKKGSAFQKPRSRAAFERQAPDGEKKPLSSLAKRDPDAAFCRPQPGFSKGSLDLDRLLGRSRAFCGRAYRSRAVGKEKESSAQEAGFCRAGRFCSLKSRRRQARQGLPKGPAALLSSFLKKGRASPAAVAAKQDAPAAGGCPKDRCFPQNALSSGSPKGKKLLL